MVILGFVVQYTPQRISQLQIYLPCWKVSKNPRLENHHNRQLSESSEVCWKNICPKKNSLQTPLIPIILTPILGWWLKTPPKKKIMHRKPWSFMTNQTDSFLLGGHQENLQFSKCSTGSSTGLEPSSSEGLEPSSSEGLEPSSSEGLEPSSGCFSSSSFGPPNM